MAGNRQIPRSFQSPSARDRLLVARKAGDDRRPRDLMTIELGDPAIGERIGRSRRIPAEQRRDHGRVIAGGDVTAILGEDLQET